jgi:hypothetical protein
VHAGAGQLAHQRLVKADDCVLGRTVGRLACDRHLAGAGGEVDDVPAATRNHARQREPRPGDNTHQIDLDLRADDLRAFLQHRRHRHDAGVVDEDVERPELALDRVQEGLE